MGRQQSLRSKAALFVSDLTTVFLNTISDKSSKPTPKPSASVVEEVNDSKRSEFELINEQSSEDLVDEPDTSSFSAFMYSLLSSSESSGNRNSDGQVGDQVEKGNPPSDSIMKENGGKKSLLSNRKQTLSKAIYQAARISGYRSQQRKGDSEMINDVMSDAKSDASEMRPVRKVTDPLSVVDLSDTSEPSLLLSDNTSMLFFASLPALVQGRKWLLLYSTGRNGISLSTPYRSMIWPGLSLLVKLVWISANSSFGFGFFNGKFTIKSFSISFEFIISHFPLMT